MNVCGVLGCLCDDCMLFVDDCVCVRKVCFVCDFGLCGVVWCVVSVVCVVFVCLRAF